MSKVKLYTVTDTSNGDVVYKDAPIAVINEQFNMEPRQLAHCAKSNILLDNRYEIVSTGVTDRIYDYSKEMRELMDKWDKTMAKFRLLLGRS